MENSIDQSLMEILRMARDLTLNEYKDRRAELHNQWLAESDRVWRISRARVTYPPIPPHPTEAEILARAKLLMNFVAIVESPVIVEPVPVALPPESKVDPLPVEPVIVELPPPEPEVEPVVDPIPLIIESPPLVPAPIETPPAPSKPLGISTPAKSVLKRLEEIKAVWK
jgi:hypothetical protein